MATQADVRRIALSFPEAAESEGYFSFTVANKGKPKGFVWVWLERIDPKKARIPQPKVIGVRVASLDDKEFLLGMDPEKFFTEPHYNGYPAILVRLPAITVRELRPLLQEAWRCVAPKQLEIGDPAARRTQPAVKPSTRKPTMRKSKSSKSAPQAGKAKAGLKDLAPGKGRQGTGAIKGGRRTTVKDAHDKYA